MLPASPIREMQIVLNFQVVKHEPASDTVICSNCRSAIVDWHNFRECCLRNDGIYLKLLSDVSSEDQELLLQSGTVKNGIEAEEPKKELTADHQEAADDDERNSTAIDFYEVDIEGRRSSASYNNEQDQQPEQESNEVLFPSNIPLKKRGRPRKDNTNQKSIVPKSQASEIYKTGKKRGRPKLAVKAERRAEVCPMCGKFIKNMSEHMRIHNNEKRF